MICSLRIPPIKKDGEMGLKWMYTIWEFYPDFSPEDILYRPIKICSKHFKEENFISPDRSLKQAIKNGLIVEKVNIYVL